MNIVPNSNPTQAIEWLSQGNNIGLKDGTFFCHDWQYKVSTIFHRKEQQKEVQKIVNFIKENLNTASIEQKQVWLKLSDIVIKKYARNGNVGKIVALFDREIATQKNEVAFSHPKHVAAFQKWKNNDMSEALYQKHPEFCTFLESSGLLSQIKVTRSEGEAQVRPKEIDGEAALFVDGEWMKWPQLKNDFEVVYSPTYQENFIVKKETREVFTYLDNGKGLQPHHPYLTELSPISKLNEEEYQNVLKKAHCFIRPDEMELTEVERAQRNENRPFVIQIVSSLIDGSNVKASQLYRSKHAYLRLVVGKDNPQLKISKGDVYGIGYRTKHKIHLPLTSSQGQFRSPDSYEYKMSKEQVVTNIPVSKEEARAFYKYTQGYFRDSTNLGKAIGFHFVKQNCTSYVRKSLQAAGIQVPTEIAVNDLLWEIAPNWILSIGKFLKKAKEQASVGFAHCITFLPSSIKKGYHFIAAKVKDLTLKLFDAIAAVSLIPLKAVLGDGLGNGGVAFASPGENKKNKIVPQLKNWKTWFQISNYKFNLPFVLQNWQREQASTFIFERPIKLAIVP